MNNQSISIDKRMKYIQNIQIEVNNLKDTSYYNSKFRLDDFEIMKKSF